MSESMPASPLWQVKRSSSDMLWTLFGIGLVIIWLLLWEWSVRFGLGRKVFLTPSEIVVLLYRSLLVTGELRTHMWATATRLIAGLMIGALPALWLGFIMGRNKRACLRYGPFFTVLGLFPMLSALPWFLTVFGVRDLGKWAIVGAAVFYPILYCTTKGVRTSRELAHEDSSPADTVMRSNWAYSAGPWIFTGLKLGSLIGVATLLGAELYASTTGLAFEIAVAIAKFDFARAYVAMFAAGLMVYALLLCLTAIEFGFARRLPRRVSARGDARRA
jgi:ABC-type nitrate/sulfonate/bicarbonate transport system permease component